MNQLKMMLGAVLLAALLGCSGPPVSPAAVEALNNYYNSYYIGGDWSVSRASIDPDRPHKVSAALRVPNADAFQAAGDLDGLYRLAKLNACPKGESGAAVQRLFSSGQVFYLEIRGFSHGGNIGVSCWN